MVLDPVPDELKDLKEFKKVMISKKILIKKIAVMHGKGGFFKIKGSTCNIPIETANICMFLTSSFIHYISGTYLFEILQ